MSASESGETKSKRPRLESSFGYESVQMDVDVKSSRPFSGMLATFYGTSAVASDTRLVFNDIKVTQSDIPHGFEDQAWDRFKAAIDAIVRNDLPSESLEILYQLCQDICEHGGAQRLLERVQQTYTERIESEFATLASDTNEKMAYLEAIDCVWTSFSRHLKQIRCIFLYLDRTFVVPKTRYESMWHMALDRYRDSYLARPSVREKLIHCLIDTIDVDRDLGENRHEALLRTNIHMLIDLGLYEAEFEDAFLNQSRSYYQTKGEILAENTPIDIYVEQVQMSIDRESSEWVKLYLQASTGLRIKSIVEEELVTKRFAILLQHHSISELKDLYHFLKQSNLVTSCASALGAHVKVKGVSILKDHGYGKHTMEALENFITHVQHIVSDSFDANEQFRANLHDGFDHVVNQRPKLIANMLATYIDEQLKQSTTDKTKVDFAILVFRSLRSRDVFEPLYKRDLAKRLLSGTVSITAENDFVASMKKETGTGYTSKLEGMLRDMAKSKSLVDAFKAKTSRSSTSLKEFNAYVLSHCFWPTYTSTNFQLPQEFEHLQERFSTFYRDSFPGCHLSWQNSLSVCQLTANYPKSRNTIKLTLLQAIVLLCFNDANRSSISFTDLLELTRIDKQELMRTMKSLACGKHQLLKKYPDGSEVDLNDVFTFNDQFSSDLPIIELNVDRLDEVIKNNTAVHETLISREHQIDAAVIRIMKAKRTLSHDDLVAELTLQVRFQVMMHDVKKRIELLIEK